MTRADSSRREFLLATAAGAGAAALTGCNAPGAARRRPSPNERLRIGVIGCGGKGLSDMRACAKKHGIVALCDVDHGKAANARKDHAEAPFYEDWREMLDREKLDAVTVSTPDHSHAGPALAAMALGYHVFVQKPLTHTVAEARLLRDAARKSGVITSMGNQGTCLEGFRTAAECVRSGVIGEIKEVHVWTNRPVWPQGIGRPKHIDPIPKTFRWDLWLGAAPWRPYAKGRKDSGFSGYAPFHWRGWWDYGTGALGDMACHVANLPFFALELDAPTWIEADTTDRNDETFPNASTIRYGFPARGSRGPVEFTWYDGGRKPAPEKLPGVKFHIGGFLLIGTKGSLYSPTDYGERFELHPKEKFADFTPPTPFLPRSPGIHDEWLDGIVNGVQPMANFEYAAPFTEAMLLGNVAMRAGSRIEWDAANLRVTNNTDAQRWIEKEYRRGFELPTV
ncbi:MAG: Gfo/Idh/MocA family oxidoreductase [bacterium]|nr:Gfo/Idh/MocA family oxidoreductase [bacterium]